jgi:hypothetical protein
MIIDADWSSLQEGVGVFIMNCVTIFNKSKIFDARSRLVFFAKH